MNVFGDRVPVEQLIAFGEVSVESNCPYRPGILEATETALATYFEVLDADRFCAHAKHIHLPHVCPNYLFFVWSV